MKMIPSTFYEQSATIATSAPKEQYAQHYEQQPQAAQTQAPTMPSRQNNKKCLRFAPTISVVEVASRSEYTPLEKQTCWFQANEYDDMRENCYMTIGLHRANLMDDDKHTMRGLEGRLQQASKEREWMRYHATAAVLNEQYQQYRQGYYSPDRISELYHTVAWKAQYSAYTKAMVDEQTATALIGASTSIAYTTATKKTRRSDAKNVLRNVINIERTSCSTTDNTFMDSCSMQATTTTGADFDINSFFQSMTAAAQ